MKSKPKDKQRKWGLCVSWRACGGWRAEWGEKQQPNLEVSVKKLHLPLLESCQTGKTNLLAAWFQSQVRINNSYKAYFMSLNRHGVRVSTVGETIRM